MGDSEQVLEWLRALAWPCAPPIGVGEFEILYASDSEVVVWYSPAREGHRAGEVAIPCARLLAAWEALRAGTVLDEPALIALGGNPATGRWLLALLAVLPGVRVLPDPLALSWVAPPVEPAPAPTSCSDASAALPAVEAPAAEAAPAATAAPAPRPRRRRAKS
jgi:hypothetical protein